MEPLVDVLVDRVCALIEGSLEEQGAHCDGEGKGGSSAEQQGVQARSIWQAEAVICDIYSGWSWSAREGSKGL